MILDTSDNFMINFRLHKMVLQNVLTGSWNTELIPTSEMVKFFLSLEVYYCPTSLLLCDCNETGSVILKRDDVSEQSKNDPS